MSILKILMVEDKTRNKTTKLNYCIFLPFFAPGLSSFVLFSTFPQLNS